MTEDVTTPPLITASWLRTNVDGLTPIQLAGEICCYCGRGRSSHQIMVSVGQLGRRHLVACNPACKAAYGPDRP
jgi:hypothetical protein